MNDLPVPRRVLQSATWHLPMHESTPFADRRGAVTLGLRQAREDAADSLLRGSDGRYGLVDRGELTFDGVPAIGGSFMTLAARLQLPPMADGAVLSRFAPDGHRVPLLYLDGLDGLTLGQRERVRLDERRSLRYRWETTPLAERVEPEYFDHIRGTNYRHYLDQPDFLDGVLRLAAPLDLVGLTDWHEVVVRFRRTVIELFIDGVLIDEEWPHGELQHFRPPFVIGPGMFHLDYLAAWDRALSDESITALSGGPEAVTARRLAIDGPVPANPQYQRPPGYNAFVGDCMPFWHDGVFHLYYLFDRCHHGSKWRTGAHQFAHWSTRDLVTWETHPLALEISDPAESSLGTGPIFHHDGQFHTVYIPHYRRCWYSDSPSRGDTLNLASSGDGLQFTKRAEPIAPFSYESGEDINPVILRDAARERFILMVGEQFFVSNDLLDWQPEPALTTADIPYLGTCPSAFEWRGWHYLTASQRVVKSRQPLGQGGWSECPSFGDSLYVPQVAAFGDRRLLVGFVPDGGWGGCACLRELVQHENGDLGTRFVPELLPPLGEPVQPAPDAVELDARAGVADTVVDSLPAETLLTLRFTPGEDAADFGLVVRCSTDGGLRIAFRPAAGQVRFGDEAEGGMLPHVVGLDQPFSIDVLLHGEYVDLCLNGQRTWLTRHVSDGHGLRLFCCHGVVRVQLESVRPVLPMDG